MTDHDPLCPMTGQTIDGKSWRHCKCDLIAQVRDDQRGFDIRQQLAERADFRARVKAVDPVEWALAGMDAPRIVLALLDEVRLVED